MKLLNRLHIYKNGIGLHLSVNICSFIRKSESSESSCSNTIDFELAVSDLITLFYALVILDT